MTEDIQAPVSRDLKVLYDRYGLKLAVTRDWLQAYLVYIPEVPGESQAQDRVNVLSEKFLGELLQERGIVYGLQREALASFVAHPSYHTQVMIAQGLPAVPGEDAKIEIVYDKRDHASAPRQLEGGKVDLKDLDLTLNVRKGDLLARKKPATEGTPGRKVTGDDIPAKRGKDRNLPAGRNTEVSGDGLELRAAIDGTVSRVANKISVVEVYTIRGDVDYSTGNISFVGTVEVGGSVLSGFRVEAKGDITIRGVVEGARIASGGNVTIRGGIQGAEKAEIEAEGSIEAKFVNSARLKAGESIRISGPVMHSVLEAGEKIELLGRGGILNSGMARATRAIEAESVGTEMGVPTTVEVGVDPTVARRMASVETEIKKVRQNIEKLNQAIATLNALKESQGSLPPEREKMLLDSIKTRYALMASGKQLDEERRDLEDKMKQSRQGYIQVRGTLFPGVTIKIGDSTSKVDHEMKHVTLRRGEEGITAT